MEKIGRGFQRTGENIVSLNTDYAATINQVAKSKYDYGEMLREQMRSESDFKMLKKLQTSLAERDIVKPTNFNPHLLGELLTNYENRQPSSTNNSSYQQVLIPQNQPQYPFHMKLPGRSQSSVKLQPSSSNSLLKDSIITDFFKDKQHKQLSFAQNLSNQIEEGVIRRKFDDRPKQITYLPESEVLMKNRNNILEKINEIQEKASAPQNSFIPNLHPTNSYNKNNIIYHELEKSENAYRWKPSGQWQQGRADLDMLKRVYKKEEDSFSKQNQILKQQLFEGQRQRDNRYLEMEIMRTKIQHNDTVRATTKPISSNIPLFEERNSHIISNQFDYNGYNNNFELPNESKVINSIHQKQSNTIHHVQTQGQGDNMLNPSSTNQIPEDNYINTTAVSQSIYAEDQRRPNLTNGTEEENIQSNSNAILQQINENNQENEVYQVSQQNQQDKEDETDGKDNYFINPSNKIERVPSNQNVDENENNAYSEKQDELSRKKEIISSIESNPPKNKNNIEDKEEVMVIQYEQKTNQIDFEKIGQLNIPNPNLKLKNKDTGKAHFLNIMNDIDKLIGIKGQDQIIKESIFIEENRNEIVKEMQFAKFSSIQKLATLNKYNENENNPYWNEIYKINNPLFSRSQIQSDQKDSINELESRSTKGKLARIKSPKIDNTQDNQEFLARSNKIDFLIGQLIEQKQ